MVFKSFVLLIAISLSTLSAAWARPSNEITIPNDPGFNLKKGLDFASSPDNQKQVESAVDAAKKACEPHIGEANLAIAVDIDETLLDNREEYRAHQLDETKLDGWNWDDASWDRWIDAAKAPSIKPVADFVRWAKVNKIAVFLITGRSVTQRGATELNLKNENIPFDEVFLKPINFKGRTEDFKTDYRRLIETRGYTIICNIGDQESDLYGLHSADCEKLPDQMYFIK